MNPTPNVSYLTVYKNSYTPYGCDILHKLSFMHDYSDNTRPQIQTFPTVITFKILIFPSFPNFDRSLCLTVLISRLKTQNMLAGLFIFAFLHRVQFWFK